MHVTLTVGKCHRGLVISESKLLLETQNGFARLVVSRKSSFNKGVAQNMTFTLQERESAGCRSAALCVLRTGLPKGHRG